jgi:predicted GNAT family N-acyltransferase
MPLVVKAVETDAERVAAYALRREVFVVEQRVPEALERDAEDAGAVHAVALEDGRCVGTGRLVRQAGGVGRVGRVGRMAVARDARRRGIGDRVLVLLEARARAEGLREIELHAQRYVEAFYRAHGYAAEGDPFEEAGIAHVLMRKAL